MSWDDLSKLLPNHKKSSIKNKVGTMGLLRNKQYLASIMIQRNKQRGRDLTYDLIAKIALQYKSRSSFLTNDSSAYQTARRAGFLDDVCKHMIVQNHSRPQLALFKIVKTLFDSEIIYNTRKIIPPLELDVYVQKYRIGFEYDGSYWHNNTCDDKKNDVCKENNILLIRIAQHNKSKYIADIKTQLCEKIDVINKHCGSTIISSENINAINDTDIIDYVVNCIIDDDVIKKTIAKYSTYHDFRKNEINLYGFLARNNILEKYTAHFEKNNKWTVELILQEISKYNTLSELIKNNWSCYQYIMRHKLNHMLSELKRANIKRGNV